MKTLAITTLIFGLTTTASFSGFASESLLDDLERFETARMEILSSGSVGSQPEIGSAAGSSESILDDLDNIKAVSGFQSDNYASGYTGSETLLDDLKF